MLFDPKLRCDATNSTWPCCCETTTKGGVAQQQPRCWYGETCHCCASLQVAAGFISTARFVDLNFSDNSNNNKTENYSTAAVGCYHVLDGVTIQTSTFTQEAHIKMMAAVLLAAALLLAPQCQALGMLSDYIDTNEFIALEVTRLIFIVSTDLGHRTQTRRWVCPCCLRPRTMDTRSSVALLKVLSL